MSKNRRLTIKAVAVIAMGAATLLVPRQSARALVSNSQACYTCDDEDTDVPCGELSDADVNCYADCGGTYTGFCFADGGFCPYYTIECSRA